MTKPSIAIVGAGVAGLSCARRLAQSAVAVRLFDKGRSPGGRLATRRVESPLGEARFDHGAQYITVRDQAFARFVDDVVVSGAAAVWEFDDGLRQTKAGSRTQDHLWVGTPGMSALPRQMAVGLDIESSVRVTGLHADEPRWRVEVERADQAYYDSEGPFDIVVIALPSEQAAALVAPIAPSLAAEAAASGYAPCWAALFAFDRRFEAPFEARRFGTDEALSWVARETSKPGRTGPEAWVVHASPTWSRAHLDLTPAQAVEVLWRMFRELLPAAPSPICQQAHRWRYAFVETPATSPFAWDPGLRIGLCGDWRIGARVEAAWLSGHELAGAILS